MMTGREARMQELVRRLLDRVRALQEDNRYLRDRCDELEMHYHSAMTLAKDFLAKEGATADGD